MAYHMVLLRDEAHERPTVLYEGEFTNEEQALLEWAKAILSDSLVESDEYDEFGPESKVKLAEGVLESHLDLINYTVNVVWLMENQLGKKYELSRGDIFRERE